MPAVTVMTPILIPGQSYKAPIWETARWVRDRSHLIAGQRGTGRGVRGGAWAVLAPTTTRGACNGDQPAAGWARGEGDGVEHAVGGEGEEVGACPAPPNAPAAVGAVHDYARAVPWDSRVSALGRMMWIRLARGNPLVRGHPYHCRRG